MIAYQLFGRLHPLVLHFPVALLLLAAGLLIVTAYLGTLLVWGTDYFS